MASVEEVLELIKLRSLAKMKALDKNVKAIRDLRKKIVKQKG